MIEKIKNHVLPEINHAFQNTVSYSQYSTYLKCNWQWYQKYAKDLDPETPSIFKIFGTSIHETIQHYLDLIYNKSIVESEELDLVEYFNDRFRFNYSDEFDRYKKHFSSPIEMKEFFEDGCNILNFLKTNRRKYFTTKNIKLLGVEIPLLYKLNSYTYYKGYVDFVLYDEIEDRVTIYDIKTSTRGWSDKDKKDEIKISQMILYKEFFAKQYGIDVEKIDVEYIIVKRKIYEKSEYNISRIQQFIPASGKIKRKKLMDNFNLFLKEAFDINGKIVDKEWEKNPKSCKYCPFNNTEHCVKEN